MSSEEEPLEEVDPDVAAQCRWLVDQAIHLYLNQSHPIETWDLDDCLRKVAAAYGKALAIDSEGYEEGEA